MTDRAIAWAALLTLIYWGVVVFVIFATAYGCMGIDGPCPTVDEVRSEVGRILIIATTVYAIAVLGFRRLFSN